MDWLEKMNTAIGYIEANLDKQIDMDKVGKLAGCNIHQFQRVFAYMANTSLAEYIRRRKLTRAAFDLQSSDAKVIDVALRYGYDSPTSFTRAFAALHGITPSQAKKDRASFVSFPAITFQITVQGVYAMNYRIEAKEAFRVVGPRVEITPPSLENDRALAEIPEFWSKVAISGQFGELINIMGDNPKGVLGLGVSDPEGNKGNFYYIAVSSSLPTPEGMHELTVPASTWAIFESIGSLPTAIQNLQRQIYTEWLPGSGYEYNPYAPDIEVYNDGNQQAPDYKCWVWLPVVKK